MCDFLLWQPVCFGIVGIARPGSSTAHLHVETGLRFAGDLSSIKAARLLNLTEVV